MGRIEALAEQGRLNHAAVDRLVSKGLISVARAEAAKGRIPDNPGSQGVHPA
jgi:hypothetical protein